MSDEKKQILLTMSSWKDPGGVTSYFKGIIPHFSTCNVTALEIGGTTNSGGVFHPLLDQFRFRSAVKKHAPSLIHLNPSLGFKSFVRDAVFLLQAKQMGYKCLVFWHGWDKEFEATVEKKYLGFFKRTFGKADGFIVLASEFEHKLRDWGITAPIFRETTNVDESLLSEGDGNQKWSDISQAEEIKVLFLARLEREKGVFETVQAIKLLQDKKIPVRLTVAGDGAIRQELENFASKLGLTRQQVEFTGDIRGQEKIQSFIDHHIYCFPTFYGEGLPTSVLEAMAFSMPVVTRPVGGLADFFQDDKMGKLVQGKSPEEIAACLEKLISDKNNLAKIGAYNEEYAKEHFMAPVVANRLLGIYDSIITHE